MVEEQIVNTNQAIQTHQKPKVLVFYHKCPSIAKSESCPLKASSLSNISSLYDHISSTLSFSSHYGSMKREYRHKICLFEYVIFE